MYMYSYVLVYIQPIVLHLAFLYLAEAVIIMPSPRNHVFVFDLAAALSGNGQSAKPKLFTTSTSLIPKNQNSEFKIRPRSSF